jgi:hypothetical protein
MYVRGDFNDYTPLARDFSTTRFTASAFGASILAWQRVGSVEQWLSKSRAKLYRWAEQKTKKEDDKLCCFWVAL